MTSRWRRRSSRDGLDLHRHHAECVALIVRQRGDHAGHGGVQQLPHPHPRGRLVVYQDGANHAAILTCGMAMRATVTPDASSRGPIVRMSYPRMLYSPPSTSRSKIGNTRVSR